MLRCNRRLCIRKWNPLTKYQR